MLVDKKRLPPYGKFFLRFPPSNNGLIIECGDGAWERAKYYNGGQKDKLKYGAPCIVFPSDTRPDDFDWSLVKDREVAIMHNANGVERIESPALESLAVHLVKKGAAMVIILDSEKGISPTYKPRLAA